MTREEAVNWIINITADMGKVEHRDLWHYEQALSEIREMLEQPERKKGKWIHEYLASTAGGSYPVVRCSECQGTIPLAIEYHYCPICGALMEG